MIHWEQTTDEKESEDTRSIIEVDPDTRRMIEMESRVTLDKELSNSLKHLPSWIHSKMSCDHYMEYLESKIRYSGTQHGFQKDMCVHTSWKPLQMLCRNKTNQHYIPLHLIGMSRTGSKLHLLGNLLMMYRT